MKLISMTDYILEHPATTDYEWQLTKHLKYAQLLKQPLTLGMFVPCDDAGNVLEEPDIQIGGVEKYSEKYQQAKERVLFEDVTIVKASPNTFNIYIKKEISLVYDDNYKSFKAAYSIEDLANSFNKRNLNEFHIELTQSAIKQIGI